MRHSMKKFIAVTTATLLTASAFALVACDANFKTPSGMPEATAAVESNGGFVVQKGEYVYFINGVENYESDNTYGSPVKGALMRAKESDIALGDDKAEIVVPSLMVAGDYNAGIYIYGDRVYYATPNNVKSTSGEIERDYLDFTSAKLDGTNVTRHMQLADNTTEYRYVEVDDVVYILYEENSNLFSFNTKTGEKTTLVEGTAAFAFDKTDKTNPTVYYTMAVKDDLDSDSPITCDYNQIYRVRADATTSPYTYVWDEEYLEDNDGEEPYVNLGEIVLDGVGAGNEKTQFTHADNAAALSPMGFSYTLQSYANGGLYFTRRQVTTPGTTSGNGGFLYFLAESNLGANWNSVTGNGEKTTANPTGTLDVVANSTNTGKASTSAMFYVEGGAHRYLYVEGSSIYRADVKTDGTGDMTPVEIATDASSATFVALDDSDATYKYVYFTRSNGSGRSVERAVYNGDGINYDFLPSTGNDNAAYQPVKVLNLQHASSWYHYEILGGRIYFADAEAFSSTSYNYVACVDLKGWNNAEIEAFNDKYEEITGDDGYLAKVSEDGDSKLSTALKYFFYTGETARFTENIQEAVDAGKKETKLYTQKQQDAFTAFANGTGETSGMFVDGSGKSYRTLSYFVTKLGQVSESDVESFDDYWRNTLEHYDAPEEETVVPTWGWALIGVGIGLVVAAGVLTAVLLVLKNKKKAEKDNKPVRMRVDTTDDRTVDVYADEEEETEVEIQEEPQTEVVEETTEENE